MTFGPFLKPLGINCLLLFVCFLLCGTSGSVFYDENFLPWMAPCFIALILSLIAFLNAKKQKKNFIFQREILLTTCLSWVLAILLGALPYLTCLKCPFCEALFESCSGFTTTGATTFQAIETFPKGLLLWRSFSQWLGGLGFVVFFVTLVGETTAYNKRLYLQESTAVDEACSLFQLRRQMAYSLGFYIILTLLCVGTLFLLGLSRFDAFCHALATISTGGFSTYTQGIPFFHDPKVEWALIIFMFLGGTNFALLMQIFTKNGPSCLKNTEFVAYLVGVLFSAAILSYLLIYYPGYKAMAAFRHALFQVVSIVTTTGFHSDNFALWPNASLPILLLLMFVGGCTGSTAGGFKIFRVVVLFKMLLSHLEKAFRSNIIRPLRIDGLIWNENKQLGLLHFLMSNLFLVTFSVLLLSLLEPKIDFLTSLSAVLTTLSNFGPGCNLVGPHESFAFFSSISKGLLSLLMLLGRLELYAILVLFSPRFWKRFD